MLEDDAICWILPDASFVARLRDVVQAAALQRPRFVAVWLYGSAARGGPARDIDLGVLVSGRPTIADAREVDQAGRLIGDACGVRAVDMRVVNEACPVFLGRLMREGRLLYEADAEMRVAFEARAHALWLEYRPTWQKMRAAAFGRWSHG